MHRPARPAGRGFQPDAGGTALSDFLTDHGVIVALVSAGLAVAYGLLTTRQLLALSPGNAEMQRISGAVQEGAKAYLNRQYTTIGIAGIVLAIGLIFIQDGYVAVGFVIGGVLSGATGYIGMNVPVLANAPVAAAGARGGPPRLSGRSARAAGPHPEGGRRRAHRPELRRLADLGLRPPRRRHLHQGG